MDDSYYGEATPRKGSHARPKAEDTPDARAAAEVAAVDDAAEISEISAAAEPVAAVESTAAADPAVTESVAAAESAAVAEPAAAAESAAAAKPAAASNASGKGKSKKKRGPWGIVFIVALIVFICSMAALALIAFSYCQGQQKYQGVAREAGLGVMPEDPSTLEIDWAALREANPDIVAWIYIPNTVINYPVVQGPDNDKYLTVDFDGDAGWLANYGAIFLDCHNNPDFSDLANFIYGHHMNDGSMFAELAHFGDQARFDECRTVYLLTPAANYRLRTFSLLHVDATDELVQTTFADKEEFTSYVQDKIDRSVVNVGRIPTADEMGRVFACATCDDYGSGRFVLYSYIEDEKATGLTGTLGIAEEDGEAVGFDDGLDAGEEQGGGQEAEEAQDAGQEAEEGQE